MIGATKLQVYINTATQLETILIHIDAAFALNESMSEFGLEKKFISNSISIMEFYWKLKTDNKVITYLYQLVRVIMT